MNGLDHASAISDAELEDAILGSLAHRDEQFSACPSEIARAIGTSEGDLWRALMPRIRQIAARLAREERISVTRGSMVLSPDDLEGGPIRLRRGKRFG